MTRFRISGSITAVALLGIAVGCSSVQHAASPQEHAGYVIRAGLGVSECSVGMPASKFVDEFGGVIDGRYYIATDRGVEAVIHGGSIVTLFFHFYSKTFTPFPGATAEGIGRESSIDEVIAAFGTPEEISESVVSPYGPMPGAKEESIRYPSVGITFTFYDAKLADIRVYRKKPNQALQTTPMTRSVYQKTIESGRPQRGV